MQMRQRDVAALDAKYTKELADAKAENDALRDDVAAGRRRLHISSSSVSVKPLPPPAWIMQPPPDWQMTPLNGIISPSERLITMQKQLEGTQKRYSSSVDRVAHIDGHPCNYCEHIPRFQRSINTKVIKPSNPFTNVCRVSF